MKQQKHTLKLFSSPSILLTDRQLNIPAILHRAANNLPILYAAHTSELL